MKNGESNIHHHPEYGIHGPVEKLITLCLYLVEEYDDEDRENLVKENLKGLLHIPDRNVYVGEDANIAILNGLNAVKDWTRHGRKHAFIAHCLQISDEQALQLMHELKCRGYEFAFSTFKIRAATHSDTPPPATTQTANHD